MPPRPLHKSKNRKGKKGRRTKKNKKTLQTSQYITSEEIKRSPRGAHEALEEIRIAQFQVPKKPKGNIDELLEEFQMVADLSNIEPFQQVRDLLGFYTSEAARAHLSLTQQKAHRRWLLHRIERRKARVISRLPDRATKWRANAAANEDKKIYEYQQDLLICENLIEILDGLHETYGNYANALSREMTARKDDRDRWYGRAGQGK